MHKFLDKFPIIYRRGDAHRALNELSGYLALSL